MERPGGGRAGDACVAVEEGAVVGSWALSVAEGGGGGTWDVLGAVDEALALLLLAVVSVTVASVSFSGA